MTMKTLKIAALAMVAPGLAMVAVPTQAAAPAHAYQATHAPTYEVESANKWRDRYRDRDDRRYDRGRYDRHHRGDRVHRNTRVWRGDNGRYYCRKDDGTTGLLIGGAVGALAGHEIAGRGDRTLGAILGAAGGALLGREIDRSGSSCR